jgi:cytochrome c553
MKKVLSGVALLAGACGASAALAADIEAGRAKVAMVCSACHGADGASVSDTIPNLAGQKGKYIEAQLKALREGSRKNLTMGPIAKQLSDADIANVAAYFSSLQGAASMAKSDFLPNLVKTNVSFPENYKATYTKYLTINFPDTKQVRYYYANPAAVRAAKAGTPLPDGSMLFAEVYKAKLDADEKPVTGSDGFYVADAPMFYTAMGRDAGWGKDIPDMLRNENWNYAVFTLDKHLRAGVNQAECFACHKPHDDTSYLFTLKQLAEAAKAK